MYVTLIIFRKERQHLEKERQSVNLRQGRGANNKRTLKEI